jgi:hypothetical protein
MLRLCPRIIALTVVLVGLPTAQAADETLALACQGTHTFVEGGQEAKPEPTSMGIVVNLTTRKVSGFVFPDTQVEVTHWNEGAVAFGANEQELDIEGLINRVTGELHATVRMYGEYGTVTTRWTYSLKCRPAQRMF